MSQTLIQSNPSVMMGKPVVAGTRITVELILEKLGAGETIDQILEEHPRLTRQSVLAAVDYDDLKDLRTAKDAERAAPTTPLREVRRKLRL